MGETGGVSERTYLDHAATTPMVPEAVEAMTRELSRTGNASSLHASGRAARKVVEEARESIAAHVGAAPSELIFTSGGTESDNLAVKGGYWSQVARGRTEVVASAVEHHAVLDSVAWLGEAAGADVHWLPVNRTGRIRERDLDAFVGPRTALVSVMWGNNEVGTLQPVTAVAARAREHGALAHSDAVQAVGHVPVDFAASGLDLLSFTAHKLGGPYGVGAFLARRTVDLTALQHGGGQERDVRSGTLNVAAVAGFAAAVEVAARELRRQQVQVRALRELLVASITHRCPGRGRPRSPLAPRPAAGGGQRAVPRLLGGGPADAAGCRGHRLRDRVRLLRRRDPAEPRAAGHGAGRDRSPLGAALLPRGHQHLPGPADPPARLARRRRPRPGRRRVRVTLGPVRVLAAMSGGVDSAVAAARAVDAGHQVTGVHLALAKNPQSFRSGARGCCSKEDAHDARRAADVLGIPFYVWDLSDRFAADVVEDFVAEYAAGRTPNPCLRCNEKIKFAAVLDRARALGFDAVCTGHYARLVETADRRGAAPGERLGQGPVVRARGADPGPATARAVPARRRRQARGAGGGRTARAGGGRQAGQPRHLLHRRRRHGGLPEPTDWGSGPERWSTRPGGPSAPTRAATSSPSASAAACGSAYRPTTGSRGTCWTSPR